MSAREEIAPEIEGAARAEWQAALDDALRHAERLAAQDIDLHKQLVNRLLEPFAWITVIITATEWANFFTQRCHPDAQPEIKHIAEMMLAAYRASAPATVADGRWHLPLIQDDEARSARRLLCKLSVARCARVSYLTHDGKRDRDKDLELYERLLGGGANGHWSPFEHVATPAPDAGAALGELRRLGAIPQAVPAGARHDVSRRLRRCDLRRALARAAAGAARCRPRRGRAVRARTGTSPRSRPQTLLHASAAALVDPVRQRRARAIADYQDVLFAGWAAAPILAFLWLWQSGNAARLRDAAAAAFSRALAAARRVRRRVGRARDGRVAFRLRSPHIASRTASG